MGYWCCILCFGWWDCKSSLWLVFKVGGGKNMVGRDLWRYVWWVIGFYVEVWIMLWVVK